MNIDLKKYILYLFLISMSLICDNIVAGNLESFTAPFDQGDCAAAGGDASASHADTEEQCAGFCTAGCYGFSFKLNPDVTAKNCYTKNSNACSNYPTVNGFRFYRRLNPPVNFYTATGEGQGFVGMDGEDCGFENINGIEKQGVLSIGECATYCTTVSGCDGFSYSQTSRKCAPKVKMDSCKYIKPSEFSYYRKFGGSIAQLDNITAIKCQPGDTSCVQQLQNDALNKMVFTAPPNNDMLIYPRTNRSGSSTRSTEVTDAVLSQTSYLARVMIQANDVFPPSHVSSRSSGETYLSSVMPVTYNSKTLTEAAVTRNILGSPKGMSDGTRDVATLAHDWVDYHISQYCDPLAATYQLNGVANNCFLPAYDANVIEAGKQRGLSQWEVASSRVNAQPFAADIIANTLFQSKVINPEAAMRYIYNLTNVNPSPLVAGQDSFSIPGGDNGYMKAYNGSNILTLKGYGVYLAFLERQAKLSLSQFALMKIFSERLPLTNIKIPVTVWDASGKKSVVYEQTSRHGLLEFEATKRFSDPGWYDRVQQMPTPALLKELAYMQSLQLTLEFKRYEQEQMQTAIMASFATDLSTMIKMGKEAQDKASDSAKQQQATSDQLNDIMKGNAPSISTTTATTTK